MKPINIKLKDILQSNREDLTYLLWFVVIPLSILMLILHFYPEKVSALNELHRCWFY